MEQGEHPVGEHSVLERHTDGGLLLTEMRFRRDTRIARHDHDHAYFCLLLAGSYDEKLRRRALSHERFSLAFRRGGVEHAIDIGTGGARCFHVEFQESWLGRHDAFGSLDSVAAARSPLARVIAMSAFRELRSFDELSSIAVEALLLELLAELAREPAVRRDEQWVIRAEELLRECSAHVWSVNALAGEVGVAPHRLARAMRRRHGCGLGELQRHFRLDAARERLHDLDLSIAAIATDLGFADQSHFGRLFKARFGTTPGEYRRRIAR